MILTHLPTPDIRDEHIFQHTQKQANKRDDSMRLRPPKLKPRYHHDSNFNRSQLSTSAHFISFRSDCSISNDSARSSFLNRSSSDETYFEQYFTCISKIGEGSFGEVFKVRSKDDGLLYAVKMSKQLFRSDNYRQERLEEVKRYEQFSDHENCVRFYKAWEQYDRLYMQMELCEESLDHYLERNRQVPEDKIWSILLDLLLALKSLHDKNLIHLDIKLDNVLIGDDNSCKLADFGLVIDVDRANRHEATEGDSRYIAPELMQGHFSKAADIFSLGISILELSCFLELPSNGPLWQQLRSGILPENFIEKKSADLQTIIKSMMTPKPHERPTVDQLLNHQKIVNLLQQRRRWDLGKKVKQSVRYSRRFAWSKLCNLRNFVYNFIVCLFTTFKFKSKLTTEQAESPNQKPSIITNIISSTPTNNESCEQLCNGDEFMISENLDGSQSCTPTSFGTVKIVNSTPLNHSNHNVRSRKDLTRTSFKTVYGFENSSMHKSNSFLNFENIETQSSSFGRSSLDTSSVHRKLFSNSDDSD